MRVLIAGGTGVIGRQLVPLLRERGDEPVVLARRAPRAEAASTRHVQADALDAERVADAVREVEPDVVVNVLTAIPDDLNPRKMAQQFEQTNRLRTEGTRSLADAARDAGARLVSESIAFAYDPSEPTLADERTPLWASPPGQFGPVLDAVRELERTTLDVGGTVLRLGHLYGPGTHFDRDGGLTREVRKGRLPLIGGGHAHFSFLHTEDAAGAIVAAIDRPQNAVFNVVDDQPAQVATWLPYLAELLGARKPRRVPAAIARLIAGGWAVAFLNELRGASNQRAREELGWTPRHPHWRDGLRGELASAGAAASVAPA